MPSIYRRGGVLWWHRTLVLSLSKNRPITLRISLKTGDQCRARRLSAALELQVDDIMEELTTAQKQKLSFHQIQVLASKAFQRQRDEILCLQIDQMPSGSMQDSANSAYARYFRMIAATGELPFVKSCHNGRAVVASDVSEKLKAEGLSDIEAFTLEMLIHTHAENPAISERLLRQRIIDIGAEPTVENVRRTLQPTALGYARACIEASEGRYAPIDDDTTFPVPDAMRTIFPDWQPRGVFESNANKVTTSAEAEKLVDTETPVIASVPAMPISTVQNSMPLQTATSSSADSPEASQPNMRLSELAERVLESKISSDKWDEGRIRDVRAAVNIFVEANGDLPLFEIQQSHLAKAVSLMDKLPAHYGHCAEDKVGGLKSAVARGERILQCIKDDPAKAASDRLVKPGLSAKTVNKHLTWLHALFEEAETIGVFVFTLRTHRLHRKVKGLQNVQRLPWDETDLPILLAAPPFTGCADLWNRVIPGKQIIHDGSYWILPLLIASGCRSSEIAGLTLDEMKIDASIPHIFLAPTLFRSLKSEYAARWFPISQNLIRLGLCDYVRAMRDAGETLMFPEFYNQKLDFSKVFMDRAFKELKTYCFPEGTDRIRGNKDVDVHSIRTLAANLLDPDGDEPPLIVYLFGHSPKSALSKHYKDPPKLELLAEKIALLDGLLDGMAAFPINLRPKEFRKYGKPLGRRAKLA